MERVELTCEHVHVVASIRSTRLLTAVSASDTTVIVAELQCTEPGCPPLETAIGVLTGVGPQTQYKVHKAMVDVTHEDVIEAIHAKGHSH